MENSTKTILVIDDDPYMADVLSRQLTKRGFRVISTTDPERGYGLAESEKPDLIISDIGLPDGNGWDLVAEVRTRWPTLRIGVITGWEGRSTGAATADFVLRKPVRTKELLDQISHGG